MRKRGDKHIVGVIESNLGNSTLTVVENFPGFPLKIWLNSFTSIYFNKTKSEQRWDIDWTDQRKEQILFPIWGSYNFV